MFHQNDFESNLSFVGQSMISRAQDLACEHHERSKSAKFLNA